MNGAPGPYRRFSKELFLQPTNAANPIRSHINQSDSDSGYNSSSSAEPLTRLLSKQNAKRNLQMHHFAPEASHVEVNLPKPELQPTESQSFHLSLHSERLSRLKIDTSSKPRLALNRCASESESLRFGSKSKHDLSDISVPDSFSGSNSFLLMEDGPVVDAPCESHDSGDHEVFSSATSSPSLGLAANSESGTVSTDDPKIDPHTSSISDVSAAESFDHSTEVDSVPNHDFKSKPKAKVSSYVRFDSRRLMKPISLPSVHPAAQRKSAVGPFLRKSHANGHYDDLSKTVKVFDHLGRDGIVPVDIRSPNLSSNSVQTIAQFASSSELSGENGSAASPLHSPFSQPSSLSLPTGRLRCGPDSLGGFNYVESRQNTRRAKRNANEKKRQERELLMGDFNLKLSGEDIMGAFDALFKLSFNGAQDWIKSNLAGAIEKVSNPLRFALKLVEFWTMRFGQRHSPSHERALFWLLSPLAAVVLQLCKDNHASLSDGDANYMRQRIKILGPSLPPKIWAELINLLELPVSEEELFQKTRELLTNLGRLDDVFFFVKELSLQSLLPFEELFVPFIRTKHYKWAAELALGNPIILHQLVMAVFPLDAKQALRIILDCSMSLNGYSAIEIAAKLPEAETIMHQGILLEFAELLCGENYDLQIEVSKSALMLGHHSEFSALCSLFGITVDDLDLDEDFVIPENCDICEQNKSAIVIIDENYLKLPVPYIFEPNDCDLEYILLSSSLVAIDLEYRPKFCQFCQADSQRVATLQLATLNCCVVLDLLAPLKEQRLGILRSVFENPDILKLGFGIDSDLHMLAATLKDSDFKKVCSILDLQKVIAKMDPHATSKRAAGLGLSQACELVLGAQLDKTEQISNWERRPLRESQILYATLDAYCLILMSEKIIEDCPITESIKINSDDCSIGDDFSILLSMTEKLIEINF